MRIQFHTPKGIVEVDTNTVTDEELAVLGITREALTVPRNLSVEIDEIKAKIADYDDLKARIEKVEKR